VESAEKEFVKLVEFIW